MAAAVKDDEPSALEAFEAERRHAERQYEAFVQQARVQAATLMRAAGTPVNRRDIEDRKSVV